MVTVQASIWYQYERVRKNHDRFVDRFQSIDLVLERTANAGDIEGLRRDLARLTARVDSLEARALQRQEVDSSRVGGVESEDGSHRDLYPYPFVAYDDLPAESRSQVHAHQLLMWTSSGGLAQVTLAGPSGPITVPEGLLAPAQGLTEAVIADALGQHLFAIEESIAPELPTFASAGEATEFAKKLAEGREAHYPMHQVVDRDGEYVVVDVSAWRASAIGLDNKDAIALFADILREGLQEPSLYWVWAINNP